MKNYPKIFIAHALWRTNLTLNFYQGMIATMATYPGALMPVIQQDYSCAWAKNMLVEKFLASDFDMIMFLDGDIGLPPNGLKKLVEDDKDIIEPLIFRRSPPYDPLLFKKNEQVYYPEKSYL